LAVVPSLSWIVPGLSAIVHPSLSNVADSLSAVAQCLCPTLSVDRYLQDYSKEQLYNLVKEALFYSGLPAVAVNSLNSYYDTRLL
jgi:hypothetical protein